MPTSKAARFFQFFDRLLVIIASIAIFVMLAVTVVSVVGRYFFNSPIPDDIVINELLMVVLVFLPFAYVQRKKQHVHVTLLTDWLSKHNQFYFEVFGNLVGLIIFCFLSYASWNDFKESYDVLAYNEGILELPEYPSRFAVFFGILFLNLRLAYDTLVGFSHIANGTRPPVDTPDAPELTASSEAS